MKDYATKNDGLLLATIRNLMIRGAESDRVASYCDLKFLEFIPCCVQGVGSIHFKSLTQGDAN